PSLITAMSQILLEIYPKSNLISKTIEEFAKKLDCQGFIFLDSNAYIIGSYYKDKSTRDILLSSIPHFFSLNDQFQLDGMDNNTIHMILERFGNYFLFKDIPIQNKTSPYYIFILKNNNPWELYFSKKEFNTFAKLMKEFI
ncbi:MAG: hypothetical protein ACFFAO_14530, partial [Candidatus Hermodarchaeota archaeon]